MEIVTRHDGLDCGDPAPLSPAGPGTPAPRAPDRAYQSGARSPHSIPLRIRRMFGLRRPGAALAGGTRHAGYTRARSRVSKRCQVTALQTPSF